MKERFFMKKMICLMAICLAMAAYAGAPTAPTIYGPVTAECVYSWNVSSAAAPSQRQNSLTRAKDSLVGVDTIVLLNQYPIDAGWEYIASLKDSSGAADTVHFEAINYMADGSTAQPSYLIDSIAGSAKQVMKVIAFTMGQSIFGSHITLKAEKRIATLKSKIYRFELWRRQLRTR
jgi:hypothetical protein